MLYLMISWRNDTLNIDYDYLLNKILMLKRANRNFVILVPGFYPQLTEQLNKFGLLNAQVWQAFDDIQKINRKIGAPLSFESLPIQNFEKVYYPSGILLLKNGRVRAVVDLFEGMILSNITYYNDFTSRIIDYIDMFDSRGFLSRRCLFRKGILKFIYLFNDLGEIVLVVDGASNRIINTGSNGSYASYIGKTIDELVNSRIQRYLNSQEKPVHIVSTYNNYDGISFKKAPNEWKIVEVLPDDISFQKLSPDNIPNNVRFIRSAKNINTNNQNTISDSIKNITMIPAFCTEFNLGSSNSMDMQLIFWNIEDMDESQIKSSLSAVLNIILEFNDIGILMNVFNSAVLVDIQEFVKSYIEKKFDISLDSDNFKWVHEYFTAKKKHQLTANMQKQLKEKRKLEDWKKLISANEAMNKIEYKNTEDIGVLNEVMHKARLLIDLSKSPRTFLQIKAITNGIPQLNISKSPFLVSRKNGIVLEDKADLSSILKESILFFLDNLNNWNISLVTNVQLIRKFSLDKNIKALEAEFERNE